MTYLSNFLSKAALVIRRFFMLGEGALREREICFLETRPMFSSQRHCAEEGVPGTCSEMEITKKQNPKASLHCKTRPGGGLVSDFPAGNGNIVNLFYSVQIFHRFVHS
jgi:hypothetical protein